MAKQEEKKILLEREYVIPLRKEMNKVARYRKAERAVSAIRKFLLRHMKVYDKSDEKIKISKWLNEAIWARSIRNPPHKIKIKAIKYSTGEIHAELAEMPHKAKIAKEKEEKLREEARKIEEQKKAEEAKRAEEEKAKAEAGKLEEKIEGKAEEEAKKEVEKKEIDKEKEQILKKEVRKQEKELIKPKKEVHKKTITGI